MGRFRSWCGFGSCERQIKERGPTAGVRIELLAQLGHELRRPAADYLRDGIYELRAKQGRVQYRILYFFHGRQAAILAHSLSKEDIIPLIDIKRAIQRKRLFESDPEKHTYEDES